VIVYPRRDTLHAPRSTHFITHPTKSTTTTNGDVKRSTLGPDSPLFRENPSRFILPKLLRLPPCSSTHKPSTPQLNPHLLCSFQIYTTSNTTSHSFHKGLTPPQPTTNKPTTNNMDAVSHLLRRSRLRGFAAGSGHLTPTLPRVASENTSEELKLDVNVELDERFYASLNQYSPAELSSIQAASVSVCGWVITKGC
jgi:hypothetical protein